MSCGGGDLASEANPRATRSPRTGKANRAVVVGLKEDRRTAREAVLEAIVRVTHGQQSNRRVK